MCFGRVFINLIIFLLPGIGFSQSYFLNHYDPENGLSDLEIHCIVQDPYGYMWIGGTEGLIRFDGFSFEEIEYLHDVKNDPVYDLMIDRQGILWIAGKNGITSYDGLNFRHYSLPVIDDPYKCYGLAEGVNEDILFFNGEKMFFRLQGGNIINISQMIEPINGSIIDVTGRKSDFLKVLSSSGEILMYTDDGFKIIPSLDQEFGNILFGNDGQIYDVDSKKLSTIDFIEDKSKVEASFSIDSDRILDVLTLENGDKWISYENKVVCINGNRTIELNRSNGFDGDAVKILFRDTEENIWLVTRSKGLYCYHGDLLKYLEFSKNPSFTPTSFYLNESGQLYVSYFGKGIDIYEDQVIVNINNKTGLASNYVRWIAKNDHAYWFITARGATAFEDGLFKSFSTVNGLPHNYCFHACTDTSGRVWIGTEGGVGIYDGREFEVKTQEDGLLSNRIKYLFPYHDGSMLLLSDNGIDKVNNGEIEHFVQEGLKNKEVLNTMLGDSHGNFWIGSDINGLIFYDLKTKKIKYLNQSFNMPFTRVKSMIFYDEKWLCIGTERGIYYLEVSTNGDILSLFSAGIEQGFPDFEANQNAILRVEDDIYFGTSNGAIIFNPERIDKTNNIPVSITALSIEFKATDWNNKNQALDSWLGTPVSPVLAYNQNDLQIRYKGISLKGKEKLWYRYQLVNYDRDWSQPVNDESVFYSNLGPGKYMFKITASYDGLNWHDSYTQYDFIVAPPFWKTWWFYVLLFASVLTGFVLINNYRIKTRVNQLLLIEKLNKEERDRIQKKVAMDFHDEVGNHLTSISLLVELIKSREWEVPGELKKFLEKIDLESKNLFLGTKDFIWSIDPKNNNLKEVFYKIRDYGDEVFDSTEIQFQVKDGVSDTINIDLPAGFTRQIVLIFKEAINNARMHAGCRNVQFSISMFPDMFLIKLSDDGIGFNTKEIEYYNGLKKMKVRGEKVKGKLIFNSEAESGTEIILKGDLNKNIAN